jgi:thiol-disulfide isomerase/thioredoxin
MKTSRPLLALAIATLLPLAGVAAPPAPDFTLSRLDGPNLRLAEQRGQVVALNFWASWCGPCRVEMPHLNRLHDKYRDAGFTFLGINVDDDPQKAAAEAAKLGIRFPVLLDSVKAVSKLYGLNAMPTTVLIDRDGRVRQVHPGYRNGVEATYEQQIRALVTE